MSNTKNHINVISLGLALGITWGVSLFVLGIIAWLSGWGASLVSAIGSLYLGFTPTFIGSIIGMVLGFIDCFIGGVIIALLYNFFSEKSES